MTALLIARSKDGKSTRTCNARCYNAKGSKCRCICGGKNHGVGYSKALDNAHSEATWDNVLEKGFTIISLPVQLTIF